jgi:glycosyltransferase involved in cell wall biosynthesis
MSPAPDRSESEGGRLLYLTASAVADGTPTYTHVNGIVDGLIKRGWTVEVLSPPDRRLNNVGQQFRRLFDVILIQCRAALRMRSFDAVYFRWHFALWPLAALARLVGVPVIQEINGPYEEFFTAHPYMRWAQPIATFFLRAQLRWADALVAVTEHMVGWLRPDTPRVRIVVVPNGADTELFSPQATSAYPLPAPYVAFVGSFARWEGIDTMIDAVDSPNWPKGLALVIAGDGVCRNLVERAAGDNPQVSFLGRIPFRNVPGVIAGSVAGLAPINPIGGREQTGLSALKLYETLACGVPVITTDIPGHSKTIQDHDCGVLIPVNDSEALAHAVGYVMDNPEARQAMGRRGRSFVESEASWDIRARQVHDLLSDLRHQDR